MHTNTLYTFTKFNTCAHLIFLPTHLQRVVLGEHGIAADDVGPATALHQNGALDVAELARPLDQLAIDQRRVAVDAE